MIGPDKIAQLILFVTSLAETRTILDILYSYKLPNNILNREEAGNGKYDFIIVGAGSGGSVLANRLSENKGWNILVLEAGNTENLLMQVPSLSVLMQFSPFNWGYKVEPQENACLGMIDRQCAWPRGKVVGGSSSINYMIHTRGNKLDYDRWAALGNEGWSYREVLPYFKKSERFNVPGIENSSYHGYDGHLCVEHSSYHSEIGKAFLEAGEEFGYKTIDYNGEEQIGFSFIQANLDAGVRCSAAKAYLQANRPNLNIVTRAKVTKLLMDGKRVHGVVYVKNKRWKKVFATKEVILSAGTIDTPKLLMLSGIGPREHLEKLGIKVVQDSKVGYNVYDHLGFLGISFTVKNVVTQSIRNAFKSEVLLEYVLNRNGFLSSIGGPEAIAFVRTKYATDSRPDLELLFISGSLNSDGGTLSEAMRVRKEVHEAVYESLGDNETWTIWPIVQHPRSVGRISLKSKNPFDPPRLEPNFFSDPLDVEVILEGVKIAMNISNSKAFRRYESTLHDGVVPGCRIFEFGSDDYWRCAIRHLPSMMNHEVGSVKMGPRSDPDAVVDPQLRVYGVRGLRVVDASIMPAIPVGHVNAGIYMIGEKAADMIKQEWQIGYEN